MNKNKIIYIIIICLLVLWIPYIFIIEPMSNVELMLQVCIGAGIGASIGEFICKIIRE